MSGLTSALSALALIPAMTGVPPGEEAARTITVALCAGGSLTIPIGDGGPDSGTMPCCAKGCHGRRRDKQEPEQLDPEQ